MQDQPLGDALIIAALQSQMRVALVRQKELAFHLEPVGRKPLDPNSGISPLRPWAKILPHAAADVPLTLTPIGAVLGVRAVALLAVGICATTNRLRAVLIPAGIAAATLAWTGHAGATEGMVGSLHRVADVAHIWAAAAWIGALAVLLHAMLTLRPASAEVRRIGRMLTRFSTIGTLVVLTLTASGSINMIMIVGWQQLPALVASRYGMLLSVKLALFGLMLGLAAINRWRLTPALESARLQRAIGHLRLSLLIETSAAIAIVALVAWLGTLDPSL